MIAAAMAQLRRINGLVWVIIAVALAARIGVLIGTPGYQPLADSLDFNRHATSIAAGDGYPDTQLAKGGGPTAFRPPLYPLALAGAYEVTSGGWNVGRLLQALLGTIGVALVGLVAWQVWGKRVALLSMALAAIAPPLLIPGAALLSEPLFLVLELAAIAAVLEHRRGGHRYRWVVAAGVLAGLAILTRTNGTVMVPALAAGAWIVRPRFSARSLAQPAVLVLAAALTIVPWTIRNAVTMDAFIPVSTQTGYTIAATYNDAARTDPLFPSAPHYKSEYTPLLENPAFDEVELGQRLEERASKYMRDHPGYVLQTGWRNTGRALHLDGLDVARTSARALDIPRWLADTGVISFYLLGVLALLGAFVPAARRAPLFVWAVPILLFASAVVISGKTRYRVVADPFLIMLAALALLYWWDRLVGRRGRGRQPLPGSPEPAPAAGGSERTQPS